MEDRALTKFSNGNIENLVSIAGLLAQLLRELSDNDKYILKNHGFGLKERQKIYSIIKKLKSSASHIHLIQKREDLVRK